MKVFLIFSLFFGLTAPAEVSDSAVTEGERHTFRENMEDLLKEISLIMDDETLSREDKLTKLEETADRRFDIPLMARTALGKSAYSSMTEDLQAEYVSLFRRMMLNRYSALLLESWVTHLSWRINQVDLSQKSGQYRGRIDMAVTLKSSVEPLIVQWFWSGTDVTNLRIYNVSLDSVSLLTNLQHEMRSRFRQVRRNAADLLRGFAEALEENP